jgi:hypothetical protein
MRHNKLARSERATLLLWVAPIVGYCALVVQHGAMTLTIRARSIMKPSIITLSIVTVSIIIFSIMTFSIMTFSISIDKMRHSA